MISPFQEHGSGFPLVLLHAFPLSRSMWAGNVDAIVGAGFRLILPDLRGFGENESFADINLMDDMAKDVAELLGKLKIDKAVIGGLSMGGYVTFALYRMHPDKFAAMLLFDTTSAADTDEGRQKRFDLIRKLDAQGSSALVENSLPTLTGDLTKTNNPELIKELETRALSVNQKAAIAALRGMAERVDSSDLLPKIDIPACLIFGEDDKITNLDTAQTMKNSIPNAELNVIKNTGHLSNLEQPEQFNLALATFLKGLKL